MKKYKVNQSGSILVEGVYVIFTLVLTMVFNLELFRRMNYETLVQQAAFIRARDKVMGVSPLKSKKKICALFNQALNEGQSLCEHMDMKDDTGTMNIHNVSDEIKENSIDGVEGEGKSTEDVRVVKHFSNSKKMEGIISKVHIEYDQLIPFEWENPRQNFKLQNKVDMEVTKSCPYPTSSY